MHDSLYRALNMIDYFRMLARYNRIANERIYETEGSFLCVVQP